VFGWVYLIILLFLLIVGSKVYYLAPVYPVLLAGARWRLNDWPTDAPGGGWNSRYQPSSLPRRSYRPAVLPVLPLTG